MSRENTDTNTENGSSEDQLGYGQGQQKTTEPTVDEQIDTLISKAEKDDKGNLALSEEALEGVDPLLARAAKSELRTKNTQAAYTASRKELSKSKNITSKLTEKLTENLAVKLTAEQTQQLVKAKDKPEEYHALRTKFENEAKEKLTTELTTIEEESSNLSEQEVQTLQLEAFNETSEVKITQEVIDEELPAGYSKKLEAGKWSYQEFLQHSVEFLTKGKKIASEGAGDKKNNAQDFNKMSGSDHPSSSSQEKDFETSYNEVVF